MIVRSIHKKRGFRQRLVLLGLLVLLSGCAHHYAPEALADPYGFFSGIWHGIALPYSLICNIVSLFGFHFLSDIQIIGRPNTGLFYYLGFFLGISLYGGPAAGAPQRGT